MTWLAVGRAGNLPRGENVRAWGNAKISPIGGEAVSSNLHGASTECADLFAGGTGADAVLCFGQADDTSGTGDTHTLLK